MTIWQFLDNHFLFTFFLVTVLLLCVVFCALAWALRALSAVR